MSIHKSQWIIPLWPASLAISRKTNRLTTTVAKQVIQSILRSLPTQIPNKQSSRRFRNLVISVPLCPLPTCTTTRSPRTRSRLPMRNVNINRPAINFCIFHFQRLCRLFGSLKVDVSEALGTTGFTVSDDACADDTADGFKDTC